MSQVHHDTVVPARDKAFELAQYVNSIQEQLDAESREIHILRTVLLKNLERRSAYSFIGMDPVSLMSLFAQWKMAAAKSVLRKEYGETEATLKDERIGYRGHIQDLEKNLHSLKQKNKRTREELEISNLQIVNLEKKVEAKQKACNGVQKRIIEAGSLIDASKKNLLTYELSPAPFVDPKTAILSEIESLRTKLNVLVERFDIFSLSSAETHANAGPRCQRRAPYDLEATPVSDLRNPTRSFKGLQPVNSPETTGQQLGVILGSGSYLQSQQRASGYRTHSPPAAFPPSRYQQKNMMTKRPQSTHATRPEATQHMGFHLPSGKDGSFDCLVGTSEKENLHLVSSSSSGLLRPVIHPVQPLAAGLMGFQQYGVPQLKIIRPLGLSQASPQTPAQFILGKQC